MVELRLPHRREYLRADELDGRGVRLLVLAFPTIRATLEGMSGQSTKGVPALVDAARATVDPADLAAIQPVFGYPGLGIPDCLGYDPAWGAPSPSEELDLIGAADPDVLVADILRLAPQHVDGAWKHVLSDPAGWLQRYHRVIVRVWEALEPFWRQAGAGIERDIERAAVAVARGATVELLAFSVPAGRVGERARPLRIDDRGLVLTPQLTGAAVPHLRRCEDDVLTHVAYPMPGTERLLANRPGPVGALGSLLGEPRALILRQLDGPRTQGQLAESLFSVPSAATHHVTALEAAGLVRRRRSGRHVVVHRTARGTSLLALYES